MRGALKAASLVHLVLVLEELIAHFVQKTCEDEGFRLGGGVTVDRRAMVFKVAFLLLADSPRDVDATPAENSLTLEVSWNPVRCLALPSAPLGL